jgi:hypothetical protein
MSFGGLRVEDRLAGAGNWSPWKARIVLILEKGEIWDIVENPVVPPTDAVLLAEFKKRNMKAKTTILNAIKDHIIPRVSSKEFAYQMWQSLCSLYQSPNQNRKMVLQEKLRSTKMTKNDTVTSYLTRISQVRDELAVVAERVDSTELVRTALNGFSKPWESFVRSIVAREHIPSWERLWDDFVQEENRIGSGSTSQQHGEDGDENVALSAKSKKKTKKGPKGGDKQQQKGGEQKKDMSKVKCFACHKMGYYVGQCPNKKKKQIGTAASAKVDEFTSQFEREYSLLVSLSTVETPSSVLYIDSGASSHMSGVREHFTDLTESRVNLEIVLGNDTIVRAVGRGTISFQRESRPPLVFRDLLYVPGLKKNLISISAIEDRGFEVSFQDGQILIHPKGFSVSSSRVIGTRHERLYRLIFQPLHALASSSNNSRLCELWHRRMAHSHHGALMCAGPCHQFPWVDATSM